jgi:hypothetical protein
MASRSGQRWCPGHVGDGERRLCAPSQRGRPGKRAAQRRRSRAGGTTATRSVRPRGGHGAGVTRWQAARTAGAPAPRSGRRGSLTASTGDNRAGHAASQPGCGGGVDPCQLPHRHGFCLRCFLYSRFGRNRHHTRLAEPTATRDLLGGGPGRHNYRERYQPLPVARRSTRSALVARVLPG